MLWLGDYYIILLRIQFMQSNCLKETQKGKIVISFPNNLLLFYDPGESLAAALLELTGADD